MTWQYKQLLPSYNPMKILLAIGTGSFVGGLLRYAVSQAVQGRSLGLFPYGTLTVNLVGCFLIGMVYALSERGVVGESWRLFLATGVLGGFTTFSAFSQETVRLLQQGLVLNALTYVLISVVAGLMATYCGMLVIRYV